MKKTTLIGVALILTCKVGLAQQSLPKQMDGKSVPLSNSTGQLPPKTGPKPYKEVITANAHTRKGLFTVHKIDDKYFFEIPDTLLGREILLVSRLAKAAADSRNPNNMTGYAGDILNQSVIRFEKGPSNKVFIRELSFSERSKDSTKEMYRAVANSNIQPITCAFDVKAYKADSVKHMSTSVIDVTELLNGDNDLFFFGQNKMKFGVGGLVSDRSYILDIKSFPINTEIKTIKTYTRGGSGGMTSSNGNVSQMPPPNPRPLTVELNTSLVLLPKSPMKARYADDRVGYFATSYTDFDSNPQGAKRQSIIERWRLEPRAEDLERYKRGELVEPRQPIVIYIDPETPAKWVPYLIQGVNDWQAAFEQAGFKNAIIAKKAPTVAEDSTWSLDDARHSAIVYKPSTVPNASGPHVVDPRSGEVIETHINWYHDVMKLVHDWYFVQAGAIDPKARKMRFDDELMGQLIRFVSSHEVGHTLGLLHNFGASSTIPVEKLRNKTWVEANGHTPSIMDYARFNYVAQPEDHISEAGIFPRIGVYDKWAIEWGYKLIPSAETADDELEILNRWIIKKSADKRCWFGSEQNDEDPRCQSEDLGDNAMKASEYGIKNLKRVMTNLPEWTREAHEGYDNLANMHHEVFNEFSRFVGHVCRYIGGKYENIKTVEQPGPVYTQVPATLQRNALAFINREVFKVPTWLIDKKILALTGTSPIEVINALQTEALARLINSNRISRMLTAEALDKNAYSVNLFFNDLNAGIWSELTSHKEINIYRRDLQKQYIDRLCLVAKPLAPTPGAGGNDYISVVKDNLARIRTAIKSALPFIHHRESRQHLLDIVSRINNALSVKS